MSKQSEDWSRGLLGSSLLKPLSGKKKPYWYKEVAAIEKALDKNPKMTCTQLLIRLSKTLGHLSRRTVNTILKLEIGKSSVSVN